MIGLHQAKHLYSIFEYSIVEVLPLDGTKMMKSPSGKLMIGILGLKSTAIHAKEIYQFLNS